MIIHFTLLLFCINLKGTPIKDLPSLLLENLEHLGLINLVGWTCLDALSWDGSVMNFLRMINMIYLYCYTWIITTSLDLNGT